MTKPVDITETSVNTHHETLLNNYFIFCVYKHTGASTFQISITMTYPKQMTYMFISICKGNRNKIN